MNTNLNDEQLTLLARPIISVIENFYADPKNEEEFQKWLSKRQKDRIDELNR